MGNAQARRRIRLEYVTFSEAVAKMRRQRGELAALGRSSQGSSLSSCWLFSSSTSLACPLCLKSGQTADSVRMSALCRYCCKSPKLPGDNFPALGRSDRRPPIYVVSITLPRSPVSLSSGDEAPHIFTRKSHLQPGEFLITSAKRLLQQNRHSTAVTI